MLDYKDVSFSFRDRTARRRRRQLRMLLLAGMIAAAFLAFRYWRAGATVAEIQELLLAGRLNEAELRLREAGPLFFQRGNLRELRALSGLFAGRLDEAAARLDQLSRDRVSTSLRSGQVMKYFFDRGDYRKLKIYAEYLLPRGHDEARWFHALCQAAFLDPEDSEKTIAGISSSFQRANGKALDLLRRFNRSLRSGRVDYVFDRNDLPLAYFDLRRRLTRSLIPGMKFDGLEKHFKEGARHFRLTLDGELQKKIDLLFRNLFGTLVLLDLPESGIAVAYSKPRSSQSTNAALVEQYEPGSVIKIITLLAYLRSARTEIFPMDCTGSLTLGGRTISDLTRHGRVQDPSRALALSCNIAFTRMGQAAGLPALTGLLQSFFFNAADFSDPFFRFAAGKFSLDSGDGLQLADLALGLKKITLTTVHAAALAAIVSQAGQLFPPYLVDDAKNILGLGFYRHEARPRRVLADDLNFLRLKKAMAAAVEDENGTGRRARRRTLRLAIKTGTTGSSASGLNAIIVGFFPYEKPRYAFAFRLEGAGRADVDGALFLQRLLQILYPE